jgi:exocyst complex component 4
VLSSKETLVELKKKGERSFHRSELLLDSRRIQQLASLLYGMQWLLDQINQLRTAEQAGQDYTVGLGDLPKNNDRLQVIINPYYQKAFSTISEESIFEIKFDADGRIDLVLDKAMEESFDNITANFSQLIQHVLFTIRIEIRCHTIFYLDLAIREGNYNSEEEHPEPDPYIGLLNTDLTMMEEMISESLPPRLSRFVFDGITQLMSAVLISNTKSLKVVNAFGIERLLSNVLSLQQNLISFTSIYENELEKCKKFYLLFSKNAEVKRSLFDHRKL